MELDDPELLATMMADLGNAPAMYRPTRYWQRYIERIVEELSTEGLRDFRRRHHSYMSSFGATDPGPRRRVLLDNRRVNTMRMQRVPGFVPVLKTLDRFFTDFVGERVLHASMLYGLSPEDIEMRAVERAEAFARRGAARPLTDLEVSLVGNPDSVFTIDGRPMTMSMLDYYMRYAYVSRFLDLEKVGVLVELGSGSGKQVEVIAKLHPQIAYFCFDLPPQLYVAEQYLKAVFPDRVVSFQECRTMTRPPIPEPGRIYVFGNWQFPMVANMRVDLFWNAASLQEMEPDVVQNYLASVDPCARNVFLMEIMSGVHRATATSQAGVLEQTKLEHYTRFLPSFRMVDMSAAEYPMAPSRDYKDTFWKRKDG